MLSCGRRQSAVRRRDQESLLAAADVEVLVGRNLVAAQAAVCLGSGFPSEDVWGMFSLGQKSCNVVSDGGRFRNNSLLSRDRHGISFNR